MATLRDVLAVGVTALGVVASIASDPEVRGNANIPDLELGTEPLLFDLVVTIGERNFGAFDALDTTVNVFVFAETDAIGAGAFTGLTTTLFPVDDDGERGQLLATRRDPEIVALEEDPERFFLRQQVDSVVTDCAWAPCVRRFEVQLTPEASEPFAAIAGIQAGAFNTVSTNIEVELTLRE